MSEKSDKMALRASYGPSHDPRFALHQRQPRADKLDARQRAICQADPAYAEALRQRVSNEGRFAAFMAGVPSYVDIDGLCPRCGNFRRRTRDRSCYACHLARSGANFERMKAGLAPVVQRSLDSHLDLLARQKAERDDDHIAGRVGDISANSLSCNAGVARMSLMSVLQNTTLPAPIMAIFLGMQLSV